MQDLHGHLRELLCATIMTLPVGQKLTTVLHWELSSARLTHGHKQRAAAEASEVACTNLICRYCKAKDCTYSFGLQAW